MSDFLKQYREQFPEYNDVDTDELVPALHQKYMKDQQVDLPFEAFASAIGYQPLQAQPSQQMQGMRSNAQPLAQSAPPGMPQQPQPAQQAPGFQGGEAFLSPSAPPGFQSIPKQPPQAPQAEITARPWAGSNSAMHSLEAPTMLGRVRDKLANMAAGAGERAGDLGAGFLEGTRLMAEPLDELFGTGQIVFDGGLPRYAPASEVASQNIPSLSKNMSEKLAATDLGYQEQVAWQDVKRAWSQGDGAVGATLEFGLEQGVKSIPDMAGAMLALPAYIVGRSSEIAQERAKNKGMTEATPVEMLEAAPAAIGSAILERIGAKAVVDPLKLGTEALDTGVRNIAKRISAAGGVGLSKEAATEAMQEGVIEYLGETLGTDVALDIMQAGDRALAGAVGGGVFGGVAATAGQGAREIARDDGGFIDESIYTREQALENANRAFDPAQGRTMDQLAPEAVALQPQPQLEVAAPQVLEPQAPAPEQVPEQLPEQSVPIDVEQVEPVAVPEQPQDTIAQPPKDVMPERIYVGTSSFVPKPIGGTLYRETSVEGMADLLRESLSNSPEQGAVKDLFVTDNPDLALGQGANKGVRIEFDGNYVSGAENKKPGTAMDGVGKEFKTDYLHRNAIRSFTLPQYVVLRGAAGAFAGRVFDQTKNDDGSVTYTRKDIQKGRDTDTTVVPKPSEIKEAPQDYQVENLQARRDKFPKDVYKAFWVKKLAREWLGKSNADIEKAISDLERTDANSAGRLEALLVYRERVERDVLQEDSEVKQQKSAENSADERLQRLYGDKTDREIRQSLVELSEKIANLQSQGAREFNGGQRRTGPAVAAEAARSYAEEKMKVERYLKDRQESKSEKGFDARFDYEQFQSGGLNLSQIVRDLNRFKANKKSVLSQLKTDFSKDELAFIAGTIASKHTKDSLARLAADAMQKKYQDAQVDPSEYRILEEFQGFIERNGKESLTAKQLKKYDDLLRESLPETVKPVIVKNDKGKVDPEQTSRINEAKATQKLIEHAEKLNKIADKVQASAEAIINQDRQTNTRKRLTETRYILEREESNVSRAQTMRALASEIPRGTFQYLSKITSDAQLKTLIQIAKSYTTDSKNPFPFQAPGWQDILLTVKAPEISINPDRAKFLLQDLEKALNKLTSAEQKKITKPGVKTMAVLKKVAALGERGVPATLTQVQAQEIIKYNTALGKPAYVDMLKDQATRTAQMSRLGIENSNQLYKALLELERVYVSPTGMSKLKRLEQDVNFKQIPGYFPTPKTLAEHVVSLAGIEPEHSVLEPSAGKGNLADVAAQAVNQKNIDTIEINYDLRQLLSMKGYNVVGEDFLKHDKTYDRIVMNPPFENQQDIDHVRHAYSLLKPGGRLVSIVSAGIKNSSKKAREFREWVENTGASYIDDLPAGSFAKAERQTNVNTALVVMEKPVNGVSAMSIARNQTSIPVLESVNGPRVAVESVESSTEGPHVSYAKPGKNYVGVFRTAGYPERREVVTIDGKSYRVPTAVQRKEPIMAELIQMMGRRLYFSKIKGKKQLGFYMHATGEIRTKYKQDIEVIAHEMAHWLDFYSNTTLPNFQKAYKDKRFNQEIVSLSYTDDKKLRDSEGFAEFVRHYMTNTEVAKLVAPTFYAEFQRLLKSNKTLEKNIESLRVKMHKYYFQGVDKIAQSKVGNKKSFALRYEEYMYRRGSRLRQQIIDKFHAARRIEQDLTGKVGDVLSSAWKQMRIANGGAEGIAEYIFNYATVSLAKNGEIIKSGKSLRAVLAPVETIELKPQHKGDAKVDVLMRYLVGKRSKELLGQRRENLFTAQEINEWVKLGETYPIFKQIEQDYRAFNDRMLNFYVQTGYLSDKGKKAFQKLNEFYVPFNRIRESLVAGDTKGLTQGFSRLKGGTANIDDVLKNIQDNIVTHVQSALTNRAKRTLYEMVKSSKDGSIYAVQLKTDTVPVTVMKEQLQSKTAAVLRALVESGQLQLPEGSGDINGSGALPKDMFDDLVSLFIEDDMLTFWQMHQKPKLNESGNLVDTVIIDGDPAYFEVQDPLLHEMLTSMQQEAYPFMARLLFGFKNYFTRSIVLFPAFMVPNVIKDSLTAAVMSKERHIPLLSSLAGMADFAAKSEDYQALLRNGAGYSSMVEATTAEGKARRRVGLEEFNLFTPAQKLLQGLDHLGGAFEYGTRMAEFKKARQAGKSDADAAFQAREISTDFSVHGANRLLTGIIRTVPFLNASMQSQDRMYREAFIAKKYDGQVRRLFMRGLIGLTVPGLLLWLINKDDEDYKKLPDYIKRMNWHIKVGDRFIQIPKPYDVGLLFGTMPENMMNFLEKENGREFAESMAWTFATMFNYDAQPAISTGWFDILRNEDWTGAPIVPDSMKTVEKSEQYNSYTSETFIRLGKRLNVSPIQAEHLFKAYNGYLGDFLIKGTDRLLWNDEAFGDFPEKDIASTGVVRRILTQPSIPYTAQQEKFFEYKQESDVLANTQRFKTSVSRLITTPNAPMKPDQMFKDDLLFGYTAEEKTVLFALNKDLQSVVSVVYGGEESLRTAELAIRYDKELSGKAKKAKLENLYKQRNQLFAGFYELIDEQLKIARTTPKAGQ